MPTVGGPAGAVVPFILVCVVGINYSGWLGHWGRWPGGWNRVSRLPQIDLGHADELVPFSQSRRLYAHDEWVHLVGASDQMPDLCLPVASRPQGTQVLKPAILPDINLMHLAIEQGVPPQAARVVVIYHVNILLSTPG
jgi:hypothetical protein